MRAATKADAAEIALLVNIATHGGTAAGWGADEAASETYDPAEIGRIEMLRDDTSFNWRNATMAESDGEVVGLLLGYRKGPEPQALPPGLPPFMVPILELEESAADSWFISMLGVHLRWRSHGIGSKLLDVAEAKRAASRGNGLSLIVEDANAGARKLYEKRGFEVRTTRAMRAYPDGSRPPGTDWLLMVKE